MYKQQDYPQKLGEGPHSIAQKGSHEVAICNLLSERFNKIVDPASLNRLLTKRGLYLESQEGNLDVLGWHSITAFDGTVQCTQVSSDGTWPTTNTAIIKFADGTYHLVEDPSAQTIIDSWDGTVRYGNTLGQPTGWAAFDVIIPEEPSINRLAADPEHTPSMRVDHPDTNVTFDALQEPKQMYVNREGGANKWAFGNIRSLDDLVPNGKTAQFENVVIVGIGKVTTEDGDLGYYMDALAFGDYAHTGKVTNTIGYAYKDLTEGIYVPPEVIIPEPAPESEPVPDSPPPMPENPMRPNAYKDTYRPFAEPEWYRVKYPVIAQEFDGRGSDRPLKIDSKHQISGMFMVAGQWYGRPLGAEQLGKWYGIPDDAIEPTDDFMPVTLTAQEKLAEHSRLSLDEKVEIIKARSTAQIERFKTYKERYFPKEK